MHLLESLGRHKEAAFIDHQLSLCVLGPWFVGEVLGGHIGACFVFGFIVRGTFVPTVLTYVYGAIQVSSIYFCFSAVT